MSTPALDPDAQARPGATFFVMAFLACAVVLLLNLEAQTKFSSRGSIVAQPRFWPAVGVIGMVGFGMLHLFFAAKGRSEFGSYREVITWVRALEFLAWFMVYVFAVPY
ncbi:MAG: tripartite tricarboxylate transporter TctB family protein, partial [Pseudomonadota bacterium]